MPELTVLIPCYNEATTIGEVIARVGRALAEVDYELIVVDDGSSDETPSLAAAAVDSEGLSERSQIIERNRNGGKTAAVRDGLAEASGDYVIIQDADLEYDPADIPKLLSVARDGDHVAVYGKRPSHWSVPSRWFLASGVLAVDLAIAGLHGRFVRDHATCYKLIRRDVLTEIDLQTTGFEGCVEMTCKLIRAGHEIRQVPISYDPRRYDEGKKLTWTHGWHAVREAIRCRRRIR